MHVLCFLVHQRKKLVKRLAHTLQAPARLRRARLALHCVSGERVGHAPPRGIVSRDELLRQIPRPFSSQRRKEAPTTHRPQCTLDGRGYADRAGRSPRTTRTTTSRARLTVTVSRSPRPTVTPACAVYVLPGEARCWRKWYCGTSGKGYRCARALWCVVHVVRVVCVRVSTCAMAEGGTLVGRHGNPAVIQSDEWVRFDASGVLCVHYVPSALMH